MVTTSLVDRKSCSMPVNARGSDGLSDFRMMGNPDLHCREQIFLEWIFEEYNMYIYL